MSLISSQLAPICCFALLLCALGIQGGDRAQADPVQNKPTAPGHGKVRVYVGGYTKGAEKGLYIYDLDLATGQLTSIGEGPKAESPSFLALHPNHHYLYAVNEIDNYEGKKAGGVSAFKIDAKTGTLTFLNEQSSGGDGPCHLIVDKFGKNVIAANYGGGSTVVLPIHADGSLGAASCFVQHEGHSVDASRQEGPHAHSANLDPANHFALVCDLGLDKVIVYKYDPEKGTIDATGLPAGEVAPGSGPRHLAWNPNGHMAYVISEMKSTVTVFEYDASRGTLTSKQTLSTLPDGFIGETSCAEVTISPDGKFLYGSNRGADSLAIFSVDPHTGLLTAVGHQSTMGKVPRNFAIDPTGAYLIAANQTTNNLVVFKRDKATGLLTPTGCVVEAPAPVSIVMLPPTR